MSMHPRSILWNCPSTSGGILNWHQTLSITLIEQQNLQWRGRKRRGRGRSAEKGRDRSLEVETVHVHVHCLMHTWIKWHICAWLNWPTAWPTWPTAALTDTLCANFNRVLFYFFINAPINFFFLNKLKTTNLTKLQEMTDIFMKTFP